MFCVLAALQQMQSSVEAAVAGTELLLSMELVQVQRVQAAFVLIAVEGDLTLGSRMHVSRVYIVIKL